ncbi:MAG: TonB-dependent receptor, partial [Alphaproteobacteria bacterium]
NQTFRDKVANERTEQDRTGFSPRAGLVYQPLSFLALYGNVAASFRPNTGFDSASRPFAPETGFAYEVGAKLDLFDGLSVTAAAFHIEKENVLTTDPADFFFQIAAGAVRSQGFDVSLVGQVTPEFRVIGGYAFIDAAVTRDEVLRVGSPLLNIPRHSGSLLGIYEVQAGDWKGFGIGGGFRAVGSRLGDSGVESFRLPGYVLTDALAYYRYENLRFGLNVDNIFDETYYERSYNTFWVGVGEPRRVTVSMTARF